MLYWGRNDGWKSGTKQILIQVLKQLFPSFLMKDETGIWLYDIIITHQVSRVENRRWRICHYVFLGTMRLNWGQGSNILEGIWNLPSLLFKIHLAINWLHFSYQYTYFCLDPWMLISLKDSFIYHCFYIRTAKMIHM